MRQVQGMYICMPMHGDVSMLVRGIVKSKVKASVPPRLSTQPTALHHCA